ncbi:hypothetical protein CBW58_01480 [Yersinia frederiksenii]|nr:hypothetical protein CBW58_23450 [Yersinia frederiksenii]OVZ94775.1 hypothetical protein CBW58_01480 [Yersinia frederiksenii]
MAGMINMRGINKGPEPKELTLYKAQHDAIYDGPKFTPIKKKIREKILIEQGYTCAYCMSRITENEMKIEHWACQNNNIDIQLAYNNLLGCCKGSEGSPLSDQTCDTKKGNKDIKYSPANKEHNLDLKISYKSDWRIYSPDSEFDLQLNKVLNLNKQRLIQNRLASIKTLRRLLDEKKGPRNKTEIQKLLTKVKGKNSNGEFIPYYGVLIFYLEKKLA